MNNQQRQVAFLIATQKRLEVGKETEFNPSENIHLTIIPRINSSGICLQQFITHINNIVKETNSFEVLLGNKDWFGEHKNIPVHHVIDKDHSLKWLHVKCVEALQNVNGSFYDPNMEKGYRPHIAHIEKTPGPQRFTHLALSEHMNGIGQEVFTRHTWELN